VPDITLNTHIRVSDFLVAAISYRQCDCMHVPWHTLNQKFKAINKFTAWYLLVNSDYAYIFRYCHDSSPKARADNRLNRVLMHALSIGLHHWNTCNIRCAYRRQHCRTHIYHAFCVYWFSVNIHSLIKYRPRPNKTLSVGWAWTGAS